MPRPIRRVPIAAMVLALVAAATGIAPHPAATRAGSWLEGIDVSHWQGAIDFNAVRDSGRRFVIAKVSEGFGWLDSRYAINKSTAMAAGLSFGAYHFARPDLNPTLEEAVMEADWFADTMGLQRGMLFPTLDLEVAGSMTVSARIEWVKTFMQRVYERTGVRGMIYVSPSFWSTYMGNTTWFAANGYPILWVAHWTTATSPTVPGSNWGGRGWTFWQYSNQGNVPGISGRVDLDRYNGTDLTAVTYDPDFALAAAPTALTVTQGASAAAAVAVTRTWFTLPIELSVTSPLPAGVGVTLSEPGVEPATVTVSTSAAGDVTPVGAFTLTLTGSGGGLTRTVEVPVTVTDGIAPTVTSPLPRFLAGTTLSSTVPIRVSWAASDPSAPLVNALRQSKNGAGATAVNLGTVRDTWATIAATPGSTYGWAARSTDTAGNTSAWVGDPAVRPTLVQQTGAGTAYSSGWSTASSTSFSGGSDRYTTTKGAWATYTFTGTSVAWVSYLGPSRGSAQVYLDGVLVSTVNLYSKSSVARRIVWAASWATPGAHTVKIVNLATSGHPRIDVDAWLNLAKP